MHQHVQKDALWHALGPYSFLHLWSSSCTSCTVPIIQQVKKMHKEYIQVSDHFCEAQTFAYWNFVKQIPSYLLSQPKTPKRHIPIFAMQFASQRYRKGIASQRYRKQRRWLDKISQACESHRKGITKVSHRKGIANREGDLTESHKHVNFYRKGFGGEGARVLTNATLRPGMPPCPNLWVVFGTSFTRSAALRNFNGDH